MNRRMNRFQSLSLSALFMLAMTALLLPTGAIAGPDCNERPDHPKCGGGGGGGGEGTARYTAALTAGGFRFSPVEVFINNRKNTYDNNLPLSMDRPVDTDPPGDQICVSDDCFAWDNVFFACQEVLGTGPVSGVSVGSNWSITDTGGKKGTNIRITFRDVIADGFPNVDIDFALITTREFDPPPFLPEKGDTSVITLEKTQIYGSDNENHIGCNSGQFYLSIPSSLEIKRIE